MLITLPTTTTFIIFGRYIEMTYYISPKLCSYFAFGCFMFSIHVLCLSRHENISLNYPITKWSKRILEQQNECMFFKWILIIFPFQAKLYMIHSVTTEHLEILSQTNNFPCNYVCIMLIGPGGLILAAEH